MSFKGNTELNPLILKVGVALAISFAGFLYSKFGSTSKRIRHLPSFRPMLPACSGRIEKEEDEEHLVETKSMVSGDVENNEDEKVANDNAVIEFSPRSKQAGDEGMFLLPEFNDLVLEKFDFPSPHKGDQMKELETPTTSERVADKEMEEELMSLRNLVKVLCERERNLEMQLLEYYGLKEQETTVVELQNRLKISGTEAKLLNLKIESLKGDNQRLSAQMVDYTKLVVELESARANINLLKRRISSDTEQNKEQLLYLQRRVSNLQNQEAIKPKVLGKFADIHYKLQQLMELEDQMLELKKYYSRLQHENSELAARLESIHPELEALQESNQHLRRENNDLRKDIEQLHTSRCTDVEELVYLRWVNACLRHELRNCQSSSNKIVARDLSKSLSPRSEEKAKQLILEYAESEGLHDKGVSLIDFDSDYWSFSEDNSHLTESCDESSIENSSGTRMSSSSRSKFFNKLKKLVRGKGNDRNNTDCCDEMLKSPSTSASTSRFTGHETRRNEQRVKIDTPSSHSFARTSSVGMQKQKNLSLEDIRNVDMSRRHSDLGSTYRFKRMVLGEGVDSSFQEDQEPDGQKKLLKYADALKKSSSENSKIHKRSVSYDSY